MFLEMLPTFMVIGAAKAGTTSLATSLAAHPQVHIPRVKEPGFFSAHDEYVKGLDYYSSTHFLRYGSATALGDATPSYLCSPSAPIRIRENLDPAAHRFVVLLRDPVQRAWSHYWHMVRTGAEHSTFIDAITDDAVRTTREVEGVYNSSYLYGGRYATHLSRWRDEFDDECFLFLLTEDLHANPHVVHQKVCEFIGIDPSIPLPVIHENKMSRSRFGLVGRAMSAPKWIKASWNGLLTPTVKQRIANSLDRWDSASFSPEPMASDVDRRLRIEFEIDIAYVERLVQRDLSHWREPTP